MKKTIQIGISDFKELIKRNNYFVDKSLLIKEFMENGAKVILTPRPRRFGKTLNLSMLKYFSDIRIKEETKGLFKGLKIENEKEIMKLQGRYPVIFITFKNEKYLTYENFKDGLMFLLSNVYKEHKYLLESDKLSKIDKQDYMDVMEKKASIAAVCNGISSLMGYMNKHYKKIEDIM